jgi:hypothetical protein
MYIEKQHRRAAQEKAEFTRKDPFVRGGELGDDDLELIRSLARTPAPLPQTSEDVAAPASIYKTNSAARKWERHLPSQDMR